MDKDILIVMSTIVIVVGIIILGITYESYLQSNIELKCIEAKGNYVIVPANPVQMSCQFDK